MLAQKEKENDEKREIENREKKGEKKQRGAVFLGLLEIFDHRAPPLTVRRRFNRKTTPGGQINHRNRNPFRNRARFLLHRFSLYTLPQAGVG